MNTDPHPNAPLTCTGWLHRAALAFRAASGLVAGVVAPAPPAHARTEPTTEHVMISDTESNFIGRGDGSHGDLTIEGEQLVHIVDTGQTFQFTGVLKRVLRLRTLRPALATVAGPLI